jgi:hypothetical protein
MTIFEIINTLLFKNKKAREELDLDSTNNFQPFMVNRWFSFYNKEQAVFVNEVLNKYSSIFTDKVDCFQFFNNITPRQKYKHIQYTKKKKKELTEQEEDQLLKSASSANISKREIKEYIDLYEQFCK